MLRLQRWQRWMNEVHHGCGCVTFFDTEAWASRVVNLCESHGRVLDEHGAEPR